MREEVNLASGVNTLIQIGLALARTGPTLGALVTAVYVVVPLVSGGWVLWTSLRGRPFKMGTRGGLVAADVVSLATWAGFILGPVVVVCVALAPNRFLSD